MGQNNPQTLQNFDKVSERIVGWGCLLGAGIEVVAPALLAIDLAASGGLAAAGFLLATGRADKVVESIVAGFKRLAGK